LRYWFDDIERRLANVTRPGYMTMSSLYQLVSRRERPLYVITHLRPIELTNNEEPVQEISAENSHDVDLI